MQTARTLWFQIVLRGRATPEDVDVAIAEIVTAEDAAVRRTREALSPLQQGVLRAVAAGATQLHSQESRDRFSLAASSSVATALDALIGRQILERSNGDIRFDSPFFRVWVQRQVLLAPGP